MSLDSCKIHRPNKESFFNRRCSWGCCRCCLSSLRLFGKQPTVCTFEYPFFQLRCVRVFVSFALVWVLICLTVIHVLFTNTKNVKETRSRRAAQMQHEQKLIITRINAYFLSFLSPRLLSAGLLFIEIQVRGSKFQCYPSATFFENQSQTRKHNRVICIYEVFGLLLYPKTMHLSGIFSFL